MTDFGTLLEKALAVSQAATPIKYWSERVRQEYGLWYRHQCEGPATDKTQAHKDAKTIVLYRHLFEPAMEVVGAAQDFLKYGSDKDGIFGEMLNRALVAFAAAMRDVMK